MFNLFQQRSLLLKDLLLIRLKIRVLPPQLDILRKNLPVLLRQHIDGSLQLREHIVVMLSAPHKPCEHAAYKAPRKGEHQKV